MVRACSQPRRPSHSSCGGAWTHNGSPSHVPHGLPQLPHTVAALCGSDSDIGCCGILENTAEYLLNLWGCGDKECGDGNCAAIQVDQCNNAGVVTCCPKNQQSFVDTYFKGAGETVSIPWCQNPAWGECYMGDDLNCADGLACGKTTSSRSDYLCCPKEYTYIDGGVAYCNTLVPVNAVAQWIDADSGSGISASLKSGTTWEGSTMNTETKSNSVSDADSFSVSFHGVGVSDSLSHSYSQTWSSQTKQSLSNSQMVECKIDDCHGRIYQWVITRTFKVMPSGREVKATAYTCHYHCVPYNSNSMLAPQCPQGTCGNSECSCCKAPDVEGNWQGGQLKWCGPTTETECENQGGSGFNTCNSGELHVNYCCGECVGHYSCPSNSGLQSCACI